MSHWPYTDDELERLNFPKKFQTPAKPQEKTKESTPRIE